MIIIPMFKLLIALNSWENYHIHEFHKNPAIKIDSSFLLKLRERTLRLTHPYTDNSGWSPELTIASKGLT